MCGRTGTPASELREEGGPFALALWADGKRAGTLRWTLLWGEVPFLETLFIKEGERGKGCGRAAMRCFEELLRRKGHRGALLSTREDEGAQHFFRRLGYTDCGALDMSGFTPQKAKELFLYKAFDK